MGLASLCQRQAVRSNMGQNRKRYPVNQKTLIFANVVKSLYQAIFEYTIQRITPDSKKEMMNLWRYLFFLLFCFSRVADSVFFPAEGEL